MADNIKVSIQQVTQIIQSAHLVPFNIDFNIFDEILFKILQMEA